MYVDTPAGTCVGRVSVWSGGLVMGGGGTVLGKSRCVHSQDFKLRMRLLERPGRWSGCKLRPAKWKAFRVFV
jgi:hypothetical protein